MIRTTQCRPVNRTYLPITTAGLIGHYARVAGDVIANYLHDLGREIRHLAETRSGAEPYDQGLRMGLYEVVTLMRSQAETFGLTLAQIGLDGFDAERTLLHDP